MKVSVAIPCYNGAAYVGQTIESALAQTHPADEILVIDDGSTDNSTEVIQRYPVRLIQHRENKGLAYGRNTAIEHSNGDILAFLDVDAFADRDWLAALLSGYDSPTVGGVGGQGIEVNIHSLADRWRQAHATQGYGNKARGVEFLFGLNMSFRREVLRQIGGFNIIFRTNAEDMDISLRVGRAGYRLRYLPTAKVFHQRTDDETSLKRTMEAWFASSYRARQVNNARPWKMFAGTLRRIVADPASDLINKRDFHLAKLSWQMGWIKLGAIRRAMRRQ